MAFVKTQSLVIFTTAFDEYAIKAFELHCVDYLLKPISAEKLEEALLKAEKHYEVFSTSGLEQKFSELMQAFSNRGQTYRNRFLVAKHDSFIPVFIDDVAYFYAQNEKAVLVTHNGNEHEVSTSLEKLESELNPIEFWRANRSCIVSAKSIIKAHNYFNYKIKLELKPKADKEVIISRKRVNEFKNWYNI